MRLIDADALSDNINGLMEEQKLNDINGMEEFVCKLIVGVLDLARTVDPVKHGRWKYGGGVLSPYCSECGLRNVTGEQTFCPHCGAKMMESDGDE